MAGAISRVVDAHVHFWDPERTEWYPFLSGGQALNMGDVSAFCRRFDQPTYFSESSGWNVQKVVHVAASTAYVDETVELEALARATGHPDAIVGAIVPGASRAATDDLLDRQRASSRFRGARPMGAGLPDADALDAMQARDLVFDAVVHPHQLDDAADLLVDFHDLVVVVEHTGWPRDDSDEEHELWKAGMERLAALGPNVHCKLSGLAMPLRTMAPEVFARWIHHAIDVFGVDRCMFASNFPVDGVAGTFDDLYTTYDTLTAHLDAAAREKLFAANAERVYRC